MAIDATLQLNPSKDEVDGFADLGRLGRQSFVASNVLVFMIRSITTKWKQLIGYFLTGPSIRWHQLRSLVMDALRYCASVCVKVIAVVCDQEASQTRLWREMEVSPENPGFQHPTTGDVVFVLPDPVHLLKSIRNNLMNHAVQVSQCEAETIAHRVNNIQSNLSYVTTFRSQKTGRNITERTHLKAIIIRNE